MFESLLKSWSKPSYREMYTFFRELSAFHESGEGFTSALQKIATHTKNAMLRKAIFDIRTEIEDNGERVSTAFAKSDVWPSFVAETLAAGEDSGKMDDILYEISGHLKQTGAVESRISGAMLTPKIVSFFLACGFVVLASIVVPRFEETYAAQRIPLPWFTQVVFFTVNTIAQFWYIFLALAFGAWRSAVWFWNNNPAIIDRWKLHLPIYKDLYYYLLQYRFVKTMALLFAAGQSMSQCLMYTSRVVDNRVFGSVLSCAADKILTEGTSAAAALEEADTEHLIHYMALAFFISGEGAGKIDQLLLNAADDYEDEIRERVEAFSTKIAVLALLPGAIGITGLYISVLAPQVGLFAK